MVFNVGAFFFSNLKLSDEMSLGLCYQILNVNNVPLFNGIESFSNPDHFNPCSVLAADLRATQTILSPGSTSSPSGRTRAMLQLSSITSSV